MRVSMHVASLTLALLTVGCSISHREVGRPLPADLDALAVGQTTKGEALQLLGAPNSIRRQFDGDLLFWIRTENDGSSLLLFPLLNLYFQSNSESRADRLALLFDHDGVLAAVGLERELAH